jgi:type VI protein secretion system component VasK
MLGALARNFGLSVRGVVAQPTQGRAYFLQRLLKQVMFKESGLAGVNKRMEMQHALLHGGVYAAVVVVIVLGLIAFSVSYQAIAVIWKKSAKLQPLSKPFPQAPRRVRSSMASIVWTP